MSEHSAMPQQFHYKIKLMASLSYNRFSFVHVLERELSIGLRDVGCLILDARILQGVVTYIQVFQLWHLLQTHCQTAYSFTIQHI